MIEHFKQLLPENDTRHTRQLSNISPYRTPPATVSKTTTKTYAKQVCVQHRTCAVNVTLPAFAAECRAAERACM